jgi:pyruvate dehydrogenase (quinone)/pyruvate oxidase
MPPYRQGTLRTEVSDQRSGGRAKTTGDVVIARLIEWGVDTVFRLPGDGITSMVDALRPSQDPIHVVEVRHQDAAFAACGYVQLTGRLGVWIAASGPGGVPLLSGPYGVTMHHQPVLPITVPICRDLIGTRPQVDVALDKLFDAIAVYGQRLSGPRARR